MKAIKLTLLIGASCIAACDHTPTSLDAPRSRTPAKPSDLLIQRGPTWHTTKLPFVPVAMNDAGTVVGYQAVGQDTQGVWYNNGTMVTLPLASDTTCLANVNPSAISPGGIVAGTGGSCVLMWLTPSSAPLVLMSGVLLGGVLAVYDDHTVIIRAKTSSGLFAFEIKGGFNFRSPLDFIATSADAQQNVYGRTTSTLPAKWSVANGLSMMPIPAPLAEGGVEAADSRGDALGYVRDGGGNNTESVVWGANGLLTVISQMPPNVEFLNSSGRYVGSWMLNGAPEQVWTSINGTVTWLASPDALRYQAAGVNSCGSIIAFSWDAPAGALYTRSSLVTPVCDQAPISTQPVVTASP